MEPGQSGASGQHAVRSAPTGGAGNALPHRQKTEARTAAECCWIPKTALMGCACKVSEPVWGTAWEGGRGRKRTTRGKKPWLKGFIRREGIAS